MSGKKQSVAHKRQEEIKDRIEELLFSGDGTNGNNTNNDEESLYDRLGGVFAIAAVMDHFSDNVLNNDIVGRKSKNKFLREWSTEKAPTRLAGLKFMRTLWVCDITGGPFTFCASSDRPTCPYGKGNLNLKNAHCALEISSAEFDEVAGELSRSLDHFKVPEKEKGEVLAAFAAHKAEVIV